MKKYISLTTLGNLVNSEESKIHVYTYISKKDAIPFHISPKNEKLCHIAFTLNNKYNIVKGDLMKIVFLDIDGVLQPYDANNRFYALDDSLIDELSQKYNVNYHNYSIYDVMAV